MSITDTGACVELTTLVAGARDGVPAVPGPRAEAGGGRNGGCCGGGPTCRGAAADRRGAQGLYSVKHCEQASRTRLRDGLPSAHPFCTADAVCFQGVGMNGADRPCSCERDMLIRHGRIRGSDFCLFGQTRIYNRDGASWYSVTTGPVLQPLVAAFEAWPPATGAPTTSQRGESAQPHSSEASGAAHRAAAA